MQNTLKTVYLSLRVSQCDSFKKQVIEGCKWSKDQWFHKFHGRTQISPLEENKIQEISEQFNDQE